VEGTGSYCAGLACHLLDQQVRVIEVNRPDRRTRRQHGKSDPIDAEAAARAVLAGTATAAPSGAMGSSRRFACCAPPAGAPAKLGPRRSTSSRRY
jgi:transposase